MHLCRLYRVYRALASRRLATACAVTGLLCLCLMPAHAQTTWKGGGGNWNDATKWTSGVPTASTNALIDGGNAAASPVILNIAGAQVLNLTIDSDDSLSFNLGTSLTTNATSISNAGQIVINGGNGNNTLLQLSAGATLSGGGALTLSTIAASGGNAIIQQAVSGITLTNQSTIQGEGIIGNGGLTLVNQATIDANSTGGTLSTALTLNGGGNVTNTGLLEATNSGVLVIANTVNNTGGNITANGGSAIVAVAGTIQGGTLNTLRGGTLETSGTAGLDGITHGALTLSTGSTYTSPLGSTTDIIGTINNNGNFQVNGGSGSNTLLQLTGNTKLQGAGTRKVTLSTASGGGAAIIQQGAGGLTLENFNNIIQGAGIIGNGGLTLLNDAGGTLLANVSGQTLLVNGGGSFTNNGTLTVNKGSVMHVSGGTFTNFSGSTLTGGTYNVIGTLEIDQLGSTGGEIVTNAAKIILNGATSSFIDAGGKDVLSSFAVNAAKANFTVTGGRNFTTAGGFTNNGTLTVGGGSKFDVNGNLTNFSGTTLTGGVYAITGTLQFNGANIVTNAANLTLTGTASKIVDQTGVTNGLANFATNAATGSLTLAGNRSLTTAGNLANSGAVKVSTGSTLTVGGTGVFTQTGAAAKTTVDGTLTASGGINISGGSVFGNNGTLAGNLTSSGTLNIGDALKKAGKESDTGSYTQSSTGVLNIDVGGLTVGTQFDQLNITGAATLGGTLNLALINAFTPIIGETFDIMNFASETGSFATVNGTAINSTEHFVLVTNATNLTLQVVAGLAPLGAVGGRTLPAPALPVPRPARLRSRPASSCWAAG